MPTHSSKLEGSPLNMQRERIRRRRMRAATARTVQPSFNFEKSVGSNATLCEGDVFQSPHSSRTSHAGDVPLFVNVQNSRRLPQNHQRPPQYDAYCQTRVSAISSSPNHDGYPNRPLARIERDRRGRHDKTQILPSPSSRRRQTTSNRHTVRRLPEKTNQNATDQQHFVYDLTSVFDPSELSTLTNSSSLWGPRAVQTQLNANSIVGRRDVSRHNGHHRLNEKGLSSSQMRRTQDALDFTSCTEQSTKLSYGYPCSTNLYSSSRQKNDVIDDNSYDSQNEVSLLGVRFADVHNERGNGRPDSFRQQQKHAATNWLCDVCKEARFESYVEAFRHEVECRKIKSRTVERNSRDSLNESKDFQHGHGNVEVNEKTNARGNNGRCDYITSDYREHAGSHLQEMSFSSSAESQPSNHHRVATTPISRESELVSGNNSSMVPKEANRWLCSVCEEVSFDNYHDACVHEKICKIRMEATADLRAAGKVKPASAFTPTLPKPSHTQLRGSAHAIIDLCRSAEEGKVETNPTPSSNPIRKISNGVTEQNASAHSVLENRQDENSSKLQVRYEEMDLIEREREGCSQNESSLQRIHDERNPVESRDDHYFSYGGTGEDDIDIIVLDQPKKNNKGEAYDRYLFLASQQEDEEERDHYIALAKQSREEELLSCRQGDNDGNRYVCLA